MKQRILVPLDGSPLAELAISEAAALSKLPGSEVILLQVIPSIDDVIEAEGAVITIDQQWEVQRDRAARYLRGITTSHEWEGAKVDIAVEMGRPAETILAYSDAHGVDRIVMSTHGRTGLGRWAFGSVADKVLRAAKTTVVLVRPPGAPSGV